jgi:hypothetical protein
VIIPQLGGFVVNAKDFTFNELEGKIYPKKKYVAFNEKLKTDDRLLSTEWAKNKAISLKEASLEIADLSKRIKSELTSSGTVQLGNLGTFTLNQENRISFSPNPDFNADLSVFGLFPVGLGQIPARVEKKPVLIPAITTEDLPEISSTGHQPIKLTKSVYVYALLAFLIGGLGAFFLTAPATNQSQSSLNPIKIVKKVDVAPAKTIAPAVVDTLPVKTVVAPVNTPEMKDEEVIYLVAASFQSLKQAEKGLKEFKSRGFDQAEIILKNEQTKFYRISLGTEHSMDAGYAKASEWKAEKKVDIWVYKAL